MATDPPYFDAIAYADLSDYFYIWHRRALKALYPDLYSTLAAPKSGELTAFAWHHGGTKEGARTAFIEGFTQTFKSLQNSMAPTLPMLVVYASKEQKSGAGEETRWESILTAMIDAQLEVTAAWPIYMAGSTRMRSIGSNAVAAYIVMACRPRQTDASTTSLNDFSRALRRELPAAIRDLQAGSILPVDLYQAALGPGMQIYSRYRRVEDSYGERVPVGRALELITSAVGEVLDEQEGELDVASRFAVTWWEENGWHPGPFGDADKVARGYGTHVDDVVRAEVVTALPGKGVKLLGTGELDRSWIPATDAKPTAWEAVHHLADRLINGGGEVEAAQLLANLGGLQDSTRTLAYRLHDIAAKKSWTKDQERYNALIGQWTSMLRSPRPTILKGSSKWQSPIGNASETSSTMLRARVQGLINVLEAADSKRTKPTTKPKQRKHSQCRSTLRACHRGQKSSNPTMTWRAGIRTRTVRGRFETGCARPVRIRVNPTQFFPRTHLPVRKRQPRPTNVNAACAPSYVDPRSQGIQYEWKTMWAEGTDTTPDRSPKEETHQ